MIRSRCQWPIRLSDLSGERTAPQRARSDPIADEAAINGGAEGAHDQFLKLVGERIRAARRRAGLKQSDLANAIGAKQPYIVAIEAGENLTLKSLARISAVLQVRPMMLVAEGEFAAAMDSGLFDRISELAQKASQHTEELAGVLRDIQTLSAHGAESSTKHEPNAADITRE